MASSSDAVRNVIYDFHHYDLAQGWAIVQQLVAKDLDSWEKIHAAYPVKDLQEPVQWDEADAGELASFLRACPLLGDKLASRLATQAAHFMHSDQSSPLKRGQSARIGGVKERMARMHMGRKRACKPSKSSGSTAAMFSVFRKLQLLQITNTAPSKRDSEASVGAISLVPFAQAVDHPGFIA